MPRTKNLPRRCLFLFCVDWFFSSSGLVSVHASSEFHTVWNQIVSCVAAHGAAVPHPPGRATPTVFELLERGLDAFAAFFDPETHPDPVGARSVRDALVSVSQLCWGPSAPPLGGRAHGFGLATVASDVFGELVARARPPAPYLCAPERFWFFEIEHPGPSHPAALATWPDRDEGTVSHHFLAVWTSGPDASPTAPLLCSVREVVGGSRAPMRGAMRLVPPGDERGAVVSEFARAARHRLLDTEILLGLLPRLRDFALRTRPADGDARWPFDSAVAALHPVRVIPRVGVPLPSAVAPGSVLSCLRRRPLVPCTAFSHRIGELDPPYRAPSALDALIGAAHRHGERVAGHSHSHWVSVAERGVSSWHFDLCEPSVVEAAAAEGGLPGFSPTVCGTAFYALSHVVLAALAAVAPEHLALFTFWPKLSAVLVPRAFSGALREAGSPRAQVACVNFVLPLAEIEDGLLAVLAAIDDDVTDITTIEDPTAGTSSPVEFEWIGLGHALEGEAETRRGRVLDERRCVPGGRDADGPPSVPTGVEVRGVLR